MAYPSRRELQVPLLRALLDLGGEARPTDVYDPLAAMFPDMSPAERNQPRENGEPRWENDVRFARQVLVDNGEIDGAVHGVWRITTAGRARAGSTLGATHSKSVDLSTDEGLLKACTAIGGSNTWGETGAQWIRNVAETIRWVRSADEAERASLGFQRRLWEENHIAAPGQGRIPVDDALTDPAFRQWLAAESLRPLPDSTEERMLFVGALYDALKQRLSVLGGKIPHLKIFRVIAALFPETMTTVASPGALQALARAMGADRALDKGARHVWVRQRLDDVMGAPGPTEEALAERISLAWLLYERHVQTGRGEVTEKPTPEGETQLQPLAAARRRRGLTGIKGLFPGTLSVLEFVQKGVTRDELLDFLKASSPEAKVAALGVSINSYQSELDLIKRDDDLYVLTERGINVLESQDANLLADWLLTRVLGVDQAVVSLRDRGLLKRKDLAEAIKAMNPSWTTDYVPQAIIGWLRSMDVIQATEQGYELTDSGRRWADQVYWTPEALPSTERPPEVEREPETSRSTSVLIPALSDILARVLPTGHFSEQQVANLHAGIWCHPVRHFAILTGLSGAGKTKLAREYALALWPKREEAKLLTLPVQPGWYDPGALLGFQNPLRADDYVRPRFLDFLIAASENPERPYVVVLDEMNLSHPEQYMAPLLSAMETEEAIPLHGEDGFLNGVPASLPYPRNLIVIGTVNMDETTHGLSDKVLDRAFVLEFWKVDLDQYPGWEDSSLSVEAQRRVRETLDGLMKALMPARLHFGWRIVNDVLAYMKHFDADSAAIASGLDNVVYAKILPKLRGEDEPRLRKALIDCEALLSHLGLEQSKAKVTELHHDLITTGSARFWR